MLSGEWGCGKTHLIEYDLKDALNTEAIVLRISLFGISAVEEIHSAVRNQWVDEYCKAKEIDIYMSYEVAHKLFGAQLTGTNVAFRLTNKGAVEEVGARLRKQNFSVGANTDTSLAWNLLEQQTWQTFLVSAVFVVCSAMLTREKIVQEKRSAGGEYAVLLTAGLLTCKRIYVAGHSNGSQMTQALLRQMPETFAAFGPTGALLGWREDQVELPEKEIVCPVWFMMGEYDVADPEPREGSMARKTIEAYARCNHASSSGGWYDNGVYHTLSLYDGSHMPVVRYTIIRGCPHTYTPEMAELTWNEWFSHFTREHDGSVHYHG